MAWCRCCTTATSPCSNRTPSCAIWRRAMATASCGPQEPKALAAAEQWMEWQQLNVVPHVSAIFMNKVRQPRGASATPRRWPTPRAGRPRRCPSPTRTCHIRMVRRRPHSPSATSCWACFIWRYLGLDCAKPEHAQCQALVRRRCKERAGLSSSGSWSIPAERKNLAEWNARIEQCKLDAEAGREASLLQLLPEPSRRGPG